ncbi:RluA family pseudouridine synthase [Candidatus Dojkabacteria bacterium]|nr:RluA family pseudouridine synthase [Candidatus Dojkabacteria bacterium]
MEKRELIIDSDVANQRLDIALAISFNDLTRSAIKKCIEANQVKVNGKVEYKANYKTRKGDRIILQIEEATGHHKLEPENIPIDIVYEDDDIVAVNKPAGMVVHPASGNWSGTLMNALVYHYENISNIGKPIRAGLIHRLDKDTSGVILVGKTNKGLWYYSRMFAKRLVEKEYILCASGKLDNNIRLHGETEIQTYVARNKTNRKKMRAISMKYAQISPLPSDARIAKTVFSLRDSKKDVYFLSAYPKTGRTHQIRVHSKYLGTPIIGDEIYGGIGCERMLLHAYSLKFKTIQGKEMIISAKPDKKFIRLAESYDFKIFKYLNKE